jgi:galactokinase/mevalonate kinase-like predicted kinase
MKRSHTGITRSSTSILKNVNIQKAQQLLPLVKQTEEALSQDTPGDFLNLINEGWRKKVESCPSVMEHPRIKDINDTLNSDQEVVAHRLCGAGNGGFFLIFTSTPWKPRKNNLEKACIKINICHKGAQVKKL